LRWAEVRAPFEANIAGARLFPEDLWRCGPATSASYDLISITLQSWCVNDLIPIRLLEARLQAIDDLRFEAALSNGRFLSQPTMKLFGQAKANYPMSRPPLRQRKASDNRSYRQADDQSNNGGNRDAHGDTPAIRNSTIADRSSYDLGSVTDYDLSLDRCFAMRPYAAKSINGRARGRLRDRAQEPART
jgi:hypothetical protein